MPAWLDAVLCLIDRHIAVIALVLGLWAGAYFF